MTCIVCWHQYPFRFDGQTAATKVIVTLHWKLARETTEFEPYRKLHTPQAKACKGCLKEQMTPEKFKNPDVFNHHGAINTQ